jgi:hypothetical protein
MRAACVCLAAAILAVSLSAAASPPQRRNAGARGTSARAGNKAGPTAADRDAARTLAMRGYELFQQGSCAEAIAAFRKAEERVHAPLHRVYIARCQAKLGKLLTAKQSFQQILDEKLPDGAPAAFKEAQALALADLNDLEGRIPSLSITVKAPASASTVTLDDVPLSKEDLGRAVPMNPGSYTIVASAPNCKSVERTVELKEGASPEVVAITLQPWPAPPRPSVVPPVVALSVGGLGIAAGGVTLGLALTETNPMETSKVDALRVASTASFVVGVLGVGIGVALVVVRPKAPPAPGAAAKPALQARIGPSSVALIGSF